MQDYGVETAAGESQSLHSGRIIRVEHVQEDFHRSFLEARHFMRPNLWPHRIYEAKGLFMHAESHPVFVRQSIQDYQTIR